MLLQAGQHGWIAIISFIVLPVGYIFRFNQEGHVCLILYFHASRTASGDKGGLGDKGMTWLLGLKSQFS